MNKAERALASILYQCTLGIDLFQLRDDYDDDRIAQIIVKLLDSISEICVEGLDEDEDE